MPSSRTPTQASVAIVLGPPLPRGTTSRGVTNVTRQPTHVGTVIASPRGNPQSGANVRGNQPPQRHLPPSAVRIRFALLASDAHACTRCPRMTPGSAVLGNRNGPLTARVVVVGEAPGRFGSHKSGVPFTGDQSGIYFERLLPHAGLTRRDIFIANAAQCNPRDDAGRNDKPSVAELRNCSSYLRGILDLLQPRLVVTLGRVALDALSLIEKHHIELATQVGTAVPWHGTHVVPLYHPSGRAMARRPFAQQAKDYARVKSILNSPPVPVPSQGRG